MRTEKKHRLAQLRRFRVRQKISGTKVRPRMSVCFTNQNIHVQFIDDTAGVTLVSCGTRSKGLRDQVVKAGKKDAAKLVGEAIAKQALGVGIRCVCFDRNRYKYHGRIRSLAEGARQGGLVF